MFIPISRSPAMLAAALLTASLAASADAGTALKLADHPTSKSTSFPAVHSARALRDRVYFGYGDWEAYTATTSVSYDPATNLLAVEHSVSSVSPVTSKCTTRGHFKVHHCGGCGGIGY